MDGVSNVVACVNARMVALGNAGNVPIKQWFGWEWELGYLTGSRRGAIRALAVPTHQRHPQLARPQDIRNPNSSPLSSKYSLVSSLVLTRNPKTVMLLVV